MPPMAKKLRSRAKPTTRRAHCAVEVINDWGLHARPAAALAHAVVDFDAEVTIKHGERSAPVESIASLLMLEAFKGSTLEVTAAGPDAEEALAAAAKLFADGFGEDHKVLSGEGTRCGVAVGSAHILYQASDDIPHYSIKRSAVQQEQRRLARALAAERKHVKTLESSSNPIISEFSHMLLGMLAEEHIAKQPAQHIKASLVNAEWALKICMDEVMEQFDASGNDVLRTHINDYRQLLKRLVGRLAKAARRRAKVREGTRRIVVGDNIGPTEVIDCYRAGYAGFITSSGSHNSHASILARGLGIPALFGVDYQALQGIAEDTKLIVDSDEAELHLKPDREALQRLEPRARLRQRQQAARGRRKAPTVTRTRDGVRIRLMANIEFEDELAPAYRAGAEGIGLYRTEFLFINRTDSPSEAEQYELYATIVKGSRGRPVTFRTIDIGHDKNFGHVKEFSAMGLRAIRYSLQHPAMFKEQLRALLRAAEHGPIKIMFPMIAHVAELEEANRLLREAASELELPAGKLPPVGTMIEIPGSAYIIKGLAQHADFFAIGTNDLIQYTLAVDRNMAGVGGLVDPCHPGVVGLLARAITAGLAAHREVTMCGELAADPLMACLYCTLGLRELSMSASKISVVREALERHNIRSHKKLAVKLAASSSTAEIRELLQGFA